MILDAVKHGTSDICGVLFAAASAEFTIVIRTHAGAKDGQSWSRAGGGEPAEGQPGGLTTNSPAMTPHRTVPSYG